VGNIFFEIAVIVCVAAVLAGIFRVLKQPAILAYILTGVVLAPLGLLSIESHDFLRTLGQVGITLLLFMIGLEIRIKELPTIGKVALITSVFQILLTFVLGFAIANLLGFNIVASSYIAIALVFSSTIVVVKLLSDKRDLGSLYGKIAVGILLVQDFLAILILILLSGFKDGGMVSADQIILIGLKAIVLVGWIIVLSQTLMPKVVGLFAKSSETLFLISLAWLFGLAALVSSPLIGFSIEIGGFLAGLALSNSIVNYQIIAKARILRDFFIILFFVILGVQMDFANIPSVIIPAIILSAFVLILKPLIVSFIMGALGYRKRTSFLTGISLAQISEFSLIVVFLGTSLKQIPSDIVSLITLVGAITFVVSTYMITNSHKLYMALHRQLSILERRKIKKEEIVDPDNMESMDDHIVIVGGDILGRAIIEALPKEEKIILVDFDPDIVRRWEKGGVHRLFGDITDFDIQERANLKSAKLVISTVPDVDDNLLLLGMLHHENRKAKILTMALEVHDAKALYKAGADYVIMPHLAGGRQIAKLIKEDGFTSIVEAKDRDLKYINQ
jgi:Kef-type K+ transport system membrane component KefB